MHRETFNIFSKTRYSLSEEDRVVNALLIVFEYADKSIIHAFLRFIGAPIDNRDTPSFREHVPYSPENIVDGEIFVSNKLLVLVEAKVINNQLNSTEQPLRYLKIIKDSNLPHKRLLLISPDKELPKDIEQISGQSNDCFIVWRSWKQIWEFLHQQYNLVNKNDALSNFLIKQYLDYLYELGVIPKSDSTSDNSENIKPQLHFLLGNVAVEKILLHLYHHGGGHLNSFSRDHSLGRGAVQRVLKRLVDSGLIKKETQGRVIWYSFNEKSPILKPILELIRVVYEAIPEQEKKNMFQPQYKLDNFD